MLPLASSEVVQKVDDAFLWIGGISLFFMVGITFAMVWFILRYRRSKHPQAADIHGNTKLEITWIVIPTLIVLFMFYKGYEGFLVMRNPPEDSMVVEVEARQWAWTFKYPDTGISASELYVPVNTPVRLLLTAPAGDVVHSFYLPDFRTKEDCVPGYTNHMWFQADRVSEHTIFCAEFCGKDHARMLSRLHVLSQADYDAWVERQLMEKNRPIDITAAMDPDSESIRAIDAQGLYVTYCASCHGADGRGGLIENARNFHSPEGWKRGPKVTQIFATLTEGLTGTQMRSFANLSRWDRFALAHYVRRFDESGNLPSDSDQEAKDLVTLYKLDEEVRVMREFPIDEEMKAMVEEAASGENGPR